MKRNGKEKSPAKRFVRRRRKRGKAPPGKSAPRPLARNRGRQDHEITGTSVTDCFRRGKRETHLELVQRLAREFSPLPVEALAVAYMADDRLFDPHQFVMLVTRRWQEFRHAGIDAHEQNLPH